MTVLYKYKCAAAAAPIVCEVLEPRCCVETESDVRELLRLWCRLLAFSLERARCVCDTRCETVTSLASPRRALSSLVSDPRLDARARLSTQTHDTRDTTDVCVLCVLSLVTSV